MIYLYLILSFSLNASANILLKIGAKNGFRYEGLGIFDILKSNMFVIFGLSIFGLSAITYFLTLRQMPVSVAYPILVGMSFLLTNFIAYLYLNEKIYLGQMLGYVLLIAGIVIVFYFGYKQS